MDFLLVTGTLSSSANQGKMKLKVHIPRWRDPPLNVGLVE